MEQGGYGGRQRAHLSLQQRGPSPGLPPGPGVLPRGGWMPQVPLPRVRAEWVLHRTLSEQPSKSLLATVAILPIAGPRAAQAPPFDGLSVVCSLPASRLGQERTERNTLPLPYLPPAAVEFPRSWSAPRLSCLLHLGNLPLQSIRYRTQQASAQTCIAGKCADAECFAARQDDCCLLHLSQMRGKEPFLLDLPFQLPSKRELYSCSQVSNPLETCP